jgi:dihydrofolate reductase
VLKVALTPPHFACVVAADEARGIGKDNGLPWPRLPTDVAHFKDVTSNVSEPGCRNAVVMGRLTWDSLPPKWQPLDGRVNVVISRRALELPDGVRVASSLGDGIAKATSAGVESIFVIGGAQIFAEAVRDPRCSVVYYTDIHGRVDADAPFPALEPAFRLDDESDVIRDAAVEYVIQRWVRR